MKFGLLHRIMTDALAALGVIALVSSGELNATMSWAVMVGLVLSLLVPERWQDHPLLARLGTFAPLGLLLLQVVRWSLGESFLPISVEFAVALQVVRLATRRGAAHDQQVIVLALLHLIAGTVLGGGLAYGLCFVGFLVVAPGALVLSHLRREVEGNYRQGARDRTGSPVDVPRILSSRRVIGRPFLVLTMLMSIPIFVFTAGLFVIFPRVGLSLLMLSHARPERMVGFSDRVDLGGVGTLRTDPTIAMRVHYPDLGPTPPARLALYLRGTAFDHYDGKAWSRTAKYRTPASQFGADVRLYRGADTARDRRILIELEPIDPPVIFLPPQAVALRLLPRGTALLSQPPLVLLGPENQLDYQSGDERGLRYEVFLAKPGEHTLELLSAADQQRYLSLPSNITQRTRDLARALSDNHEGALEVARAIEARLRRDYRYDLATRSGLEKNPLDHFLFESKGGHCEYFSTAMAVMLRTLGIPSRNVTGFVGGSYNRFGNFYAVRQGDAHSWVEAYVPRLGWTRFDPTPPADSAPISETTGVLASLRDFLEASNQRWNEHVVGYDLKQQVSLLSKVRSEYRSLRRFPSFDFAFGSLRRGVALLVGLGLVGYGLYWLGRHFRRSGPKAADPTRLPAQVTRMIGLYATLESALSVHGIVRSPGTPPLAHALALRDAGHPLGQEALELTRVYLAVRFGGESLSAGEQESFEQRVRALRAHKAKLKAAA